MNNKRIYIFMTDANGNHIIEDESRYLIGSEFSTERAEKTAKSHSKLETSSGFYVFLDACNNLRGGYAKAI